MIEKGAKHTVAVRDTVFLDCLQFLDHCESKVPFDILKNHILIMQCEHRFLNVNFGLAAYGRNVKTLIEGPLEVSPLHMGKNTVTYQARLLKSLMLKLLEQ